MSEQSWHGEQLSRERQLQAMRSEQRLGQIVFWLDAGELKVWKRK